LKGPKGQKATRTDFLRTRFFYSICALIGVTFNDGNYGDYGNEGHDGHDDDEGNDDNNDDDGVDGVGRGESTLWIRRERKM